jgi:3-isopropylmalate/(R)-2-methylmalate dehydratase small subunit
MPIEGRVWKYGDNVNTDVIFPGKYTYTITDPAEMAAHALEDLDASFADRVQPGDVIVAGRNWGCGSSREQAATCLKAAGVGAIVAGSYARIFFRNAINSGLPVIVCPDLLSAVEAGDLVRIDLSQGEIRCPSGTFGFDSFPDSVRRILSGGGIIPHLLKTLEDS